MSRITHKQCFKCKQTKPLKEFYVHPNMGDGRLNKCKECAKADVRANYRANIAYYKEYEKSRAYLPERIEARKEYSLTQAGREALRRGQKAYYCRHPDRRAAHAAVSNALRDGKLIRQPCEVCNESNAEAHHDDYSKPLDVRWLCKNHHNEHHRMVG